MRLLTVALLLLFRSETEGRARVPAQRHHGSHSVIAAASHGALLAATPVPNDVDAALPPLLASEPILYEGRVASAPAPTRDAVPARSYERTTSQAARPPPLHS
jgi:hypothetical protein